MDPDKNDPTLPARGRRGLATAADPDIAQQNEPKKPSSFLRSTLESGAKTAAKRAGQAMESAKQVDAAKVGKAVGMAAGTALTAKQATRGVTTAVASTAKDVAFVAAAEAGKKAYEMKTRSASAGSGKMTSTGGGGGDVGGTKRPSKNTASVGAAAQPEQPLVVQELLHDSPPGGFSGPQPAVGAADEDGGSKPKASAVGQTSVLTSVKSVGLTAAAQTASVAMRAGAGAMEGFKLQQEQADVFKKATADQIYSYLPAAERELLLQAKKTLAEKKAGVFEDLKAQALDWSEPMVDGLLDKVRDRFARSLLSDPDMPARVKVKAKWAFAGLWADVKDEVKLAVKSSVLKHDQSSHPGDGAFTPLCCGAAAPGCYTSQPYAAVRSFVLSHYLPYDKSVFGKMKDPVHVCFFLLTLLPIFAVRALFFAAVLFFICVGTPRNQKRPDEYILLQYILSFKGFQFVTGGIVMALYGAMEYYVCVQSDSCAKNGPGRENSLNSLGWSVLDFCLSVGLVWAAFLALPFSEKHGGVTYKSSRANQIENRNDEKSDEHLCGTGCCATVIFPLTWFSCCRVNKNRGGRIFPLLGYDYCAMLFSAACVVLLAVQRSSSSADKDSTGEQNNGSRFFDAEGISTDIFWGKVLYSLLSFPFLLFTVPGLNRLLTHGIPTGYARNGYVRAAELREDPFWDQQETHGGGKLMAAGETAPKRELDIGV